MAPTSFWGGVTGGGPSQTARRRSIWSMTSFGCAPPSESHPDLASIGVERLGVGSRCPITAHSPSTDPGWLALAGTNPNPQSSSRQVSKARPPPEPTRRERGGRHRTWTLAARVRAARLSNAPGRPSLDGPMRCSFWGGAGRSVNRSRRRDARMSFSPVPTNLHSAYPHDRSIPTGPQRPDRQG